MTTKSKPIAKLDLTGLTQSRGLSGIAAEANKDKILLLDPSEIEAPDQVRRVFRHIDELRASLEAEGQQSPVIVGPRKANGKYELKKGGRRLMAASIHPPMKVKAIIDTTDYSTKQHKAVLSQVVENIQRDDLLPHEIGRAFLAARELALASGEKLTNRAIALDVGKSETYVSLHISLAEMPEELTNLIENEITRDADILHNLRTLSELNTDVYRRVLAEANETRTLDRASVREAVRLAKAILAGDLPPDATSLLKPNAPAAREQTQAQTDASLPGKAPDSAVIPNKQEATQGTQQNGGANASTASQKLPHAEGGVPTNDAGVATQQEELNNQDGGQAQGGKSAPNNDASVKNQPEVAAEAGARNVAKKQVNIRPDQMIIFVRVIFESTAENGHLITDRVCTDPNKVYVNILDSQGQAVAKLVPVDSVELISVGHRP